MQYHRRRQFEADLLDAVAEILASHETAEHRSVLEGRLSALVDALLLARQPIVSAEVTVLLADLRGFTALSDAIAPVLTSELLNRYYSAMSRQVVEHGGVVDKFVGDAVLALFGGRGAEGGDLCQAINCAIAMQRAMQDLNTESEAQGQPRLHAGIAVSTGPVMVGSFGSDWHSEYTAVGEAVNLASRIEAYALRGQVLLSEASHDAAREFIEIGHINEVMPKGKSVPVRLYELKASTRPRRLEVPDAEPRTAPRIKVDIPLRFRRVEDKKVMYQSLEGRAQDLGYHGMSADLPIALPACSEVVVALEPSALDQGKSIGDLYARVLRTQRVRGRYRTNLEFTSVGTPAQQIIKRYVDDKLWGR